MMRTQTWKLWHVILGGWTLGGVLLSLQYYSAGVSMGIPHPLPVPVLAGFTEAYLWAGVTFGALWVSRRFPLVPGRWMVSIPVHAGAGLVLLAARIFVGLHLLSLFLPAELPSFTEALVRLPEYFIRYWLLLGAVHAVEYARRSQEREVAAANLRTELATAQLQVLKGQLHPHFLFNSLHAVSALMYSDVREADRMLSRIAEVLRRSLQSADVQEVTLGEELEFLGPYLEIEQTRFQDRLCVEVDVDPELRQALVPHMLLQPLVENSLRHGIAPRRGGGSLRIAARSRDRRLLLEVADDGPGFSGDTPAKGGGIGLSNTRARLAHLYGPDHRFEVHGDGPGFVVRIEIPLRRAILSSTTAPGVCA
ncbi:MAG TPA: histidine kinase [Longimicrobiaceae bacterium]|nr:histidine kinase [Longimicrobiaceae bacterium]